VCKEERLEDLKQQKIKKDTSIVHSDRSHRRYVSVLQNTLT